LAEIKHQEESNLLHPEPPACTKLLHTTPPDAGSKPTWETFNRPTGEHQASCSILPATPGINQHSPLGRLTPHRAKIKWIKKMWYLYTMEFYSAMKKNEILSFANKWIELENIILSEVSQAQNTKNCMLSLICRL
jgi:hypothetical protein